MGKEVTTAGQHDSPCQNPAGGCWPRAWLLWLKTHTLACDMARCQPEREKKCGDLPGS